MFVDIFGYLLIAVKSLHRDTEIVSLSTPSTTTTPPTRKPSTFCNPMIDLWCYIENQRRVFPITVQPDRTIGHLAKQIYDEHAKFIVECGYSNLTLTKVRYAMLSM